MCTYVSDATASLLCWVSASLTHSSNILTWASLKIDNSMCDQKLGDVIINILGHTWNYQFSVRPR